jgi:hypothetical protein
MKVFAIISIARQVQGEYVICKVEKAFTSSVKAGEYANSLARQYAETIQTASGPLQCVCERGVFEIEVTE